MDRQNGPDPERQPPPVFSCSGSADTGAIADGAARKLSAEGTATFYCLAGVGAKVEEIMRDPAAAEHLIAINGCSNDCCSKMLESAGFKPALQIRITDFGMPKGQTPPTRKRIRRVAEDIRRRIEEQGPDAA